MKIRRSLLKQTAAVETYSGESAYGPVYAASVTIACNIDPKRRLVRTIDGAEALSELTIHVHPDDAALLVPESRITVEGRQSSIITVSAKTLRGSVSHVEAACS